MGEFVRKRVAAGRPLLNSALKDGLIVLAVLAVTETVLQFAAPEYGMRVFDNEFTGSKPIERNALGFRGPLIAEARTPGSLRVLALGDSTTWGTDVASNETWPWLFASRLERECGRPVEAINAGVVAASVGELDQTYERLWKNYDPDLVALVVTGNMVALSAIRKDGEVRMPGNAPAEGAGSRSLRNRVVTRAGRLLHALCLPSFLSVNVQRALFWFGLANHDLDLKEPRGPLFAYGLHQGNISPDRAEAAWAKTAKEIETLRDALRRDGKKLLVTFLPPRFAISQKISDNEKRVPCDRLTIDAPARFAEICKDLGVAYCDLTSALRAAASNDRSNGPLYVLFDYVHLSPLGHQILAEVLASCEQPEALCGSSARVSGS